MLDKTHLAIAIGVSITCLDVDPEPPFAEIDAEVGDILGPADPGGRPY